MKDNTETDIMNDYIRKLDMLDKLIKEDKTLSEESVTNSESLDQLKILNNSICSKLDKIKQDIDEQNTEISNTEDSIQRFQEKIKIIKQQDEIKKNNNEQEQNENLKKDIMKISFIMIKESARILYLLFTLLFILLISITLYYLSNKENVSFVTIFNSLLKNKKF